MLRLQRLGSNTETGVPYTEEEIMAIVRKGKQQGHLPGVGSVLSGRATDGCPSAPQSTIDPADVEKLKKSNKSLTKQWVPTEWGRRDMSRSAMRTDDEDESDLEDVERKSSTVPLDSLAETMLAPPSRPGKYPLAKLSPSIFSGRQVARDWYRPSDKSPGRLE
ncbi:hypothetical protein Tco_0879789 [Tanacetum coccineum]